MTIRAKLYAAIALTILGPLLTTLVALEGQSRLGDSFDEVQQRADDAALAQAIKFDVTDTNGWQTAYGYAGDGRFRAEYVASRDQLDRNLTIAEEELTERGEQDLIAQLRTQFDQFLALDDVAFRALQRGDAAEVKRIFLGPELVRFEAMAATAQELADYEAESAAEADAAFDDDRDQARKRLIAVGLAAAMVIVLLLVTAQDVVRLAIEGGRSREDGTEGGEEDSGSS
jgi:Four helix bundle sensory module for signal transduction